MSIARLVSVGAVLLLSSSLAAANDNPTAAKAVTITLAEALEQTVERNPQLIAYGYQVEAQRGRVEQAGFGPAPELSFMSEDIFGTGGFNRVDVGQTTLTLSWFFERGKGNRRIEASSAGVALFEADAEIGRLDAAAETARRYLDCLDVQTQMQQISLAINYAGQVVEALEGRVDAGRSRKAELARARAQLARLVLEQEDTEHVLRVAIRRLAAQWGDSDPEFTRVAGNIKALPKPVEFQALVARIDENPEVARYLNEQRLREAELRLGEVEAKSNIRLDVGVRRYEQTSDYAMVAGFSLPLSSESRRNSRSAVARARLAQVDADSAAAKIRVQTELYALYEDLSHSLHRAETLRDEILPQLEVALRDAERGYSAGRYGFFELNLMQKEVLDVTTELIDASVAAHRVAVEIERLTGVNLTAYAPIGEK